MKAKQVQNQIKLLKLTFQQVNKEIDQFIEDTKSYRGHYSFRDLKSNLAYVKSRFENIKPYFEECERNLRVEIDNETNNAVSLED